jgi:hypothetical protein
MTPTQAYRAETLAITHSEPGPLGFKLEAVAITYNAINNNPTGSSSSCAVRVTESSRIAAIRPGDILVGLHGDTSFLVPMGIPPQSHLQTVAARLTAARPVRLRVFRCPRVGALQAQVAVPIVLSSDEASVLLGVVPNIPAVAPTPTPMPMPMTAQNPAPPTRSVGFADESLLSSPPAGQPAAFASPAPSPYRLDNTFSTTVDTIPDAMADHGESMLYEVQFPENGTCTWC